MTGERDGAPLPRWEDLLSAGSGVLEVAGQHSEPEPLLRNVPPAELERRLGADPVRALRELAASPEVERELQYRVFGLRRGSWQVMFPLRHDSIVLDLGSDFGAVGRSLARNCGHVIGLDRSRARLAVSDAVNRSLGIRNFRLAHASPDAISSWPEACVDGVVLSGSWPTDGERLLRDVRVRLRPGGWLYLAGRNGRALGIASDGEGAAPSLAEWNALLKAAGFESAETWIPLPGHAHADTLLPWTESTEVQTLLHAYGVRKTWKRWVLARRFARPRIPRDVSLVATTGASRRSDAWLDDAQRPLDVHKIYLNQDRASVWYRGPGGNRIRDIVLGDGGAADARRLGVIADAWRDAPDAPAYFATWRIDGPEPRPWMDRPNVTGTPLSGIAGPVQDAHREAVCGQLRILEQAGARVVLPVLDLAGALEHFLAASVRAEPPSGLADRLRRTARSLQQRFPGDRTILMHGDLTPNNVLFHDGRAELIDWDLATPVDFAGYDILNLIRYDQCGPQPDPDYWPGVVDGCSRGHVDPETARWIERAAGPADPVAAMAAFWLLRMARGVGFGDAWIERNAIPSLERAEAWLA